MRKVRKQRSGQGMEAPAECDMEAIGEEGDEDMRLDARCILVKLTPRPTDLLST